MRADVPQSRPVLPVAQKIHRLVAKVEKVVKPPRIPMNTNARAQGGNARLGQLRKKADHQQPVRLTISVPNGNDGLFMLCWITAADPVAHTEPMNPPARRIALYPRIPGNLRRLNAEKFLLVLATSEAPWIWIKTAQRSRNDTRQRSCRVWLVVLFSSVTGLPFEGFSCHCIFLFH